MTEHAANTQAIIDRFVRAAEEFFAAGEAVLEHGVDRRQRAAVGEYSLSIAEAAHQAERIAAKIREAD